MFAKYLTTMLV